MPSQISGQAAKPSKKQQQPPKKAPLQKRIGKIIKSVNPFD